ncbi:putative Tannase/feruloyl esterase [Seiridium cardinale]|uniref:Carboxylic ester hydrolase n=1 Tax=Seiridium cardinale TaxID=138064 RepID=A0ABR2XM27_9PEZI
MAGLGRRGRVVQFADKRVPRQITSSPLSQRSNHTILMALLTLPFLWALLTFLSPYLSGTCTAQSVDPGNCSAATFAAVLPSNAVIERIDYVADGGAYGEGAKDLGYPNNVTGLPELCALIINVTSSSTSNFRFGLFLPTTDNWNGRILTVGNGGFLGGINWRDMGPGPHYGFPTLSTDTGHVSANGDITWGYNDPETVTDWGWRAIHGSVVIAKLLVETFYQQPIDYSYYSGCSTGGRQGLKEIQLNPDAFDGALIGAPAWDPAALMPWITRLATFDLPITDPGAFTNITQFQLLANVVRTQCDSDDGLQDNIVSSPEMCEPDLSVIQCGNEGVNASSCLTPEQIENAKKVWQDYYTANGTFVYPGLEHSSEAQWDIWQLYGNPANFDQGWEKYFLYNDPSWTIDEFNDTVFYDARRINPGNATADGFDISAFRDHGGKLLMYHGTSDGYIPTRSSIDFYNKTKEAVGGDVDDFYRLFLIPGMQHCWLSPAGVNAPWMIGGGGQQNALGAYTTGYSVPDNVNRQHDAMLALMAWVESATEVDSIIASAFNISTGALQISRQRPLCPYPQKALYNQTGDPNDADSWSCA